MGTLTFDAGSTDAASLNYSVDGTVVAKSVTRQLWKLEDFSGNYHGGFVYEIIPLHGPCIGGHAEDFGPITVTQAKDGALTLTTQFLSNSCAFSGMYSQAGHMGSTQGTFTCGDSDHGSFMTFEMERTASGMTGRFTGETTFCEFSGRFGGVLR